MGILPSFRLNSQSLAKSESAGDESFASNASISSSETTAVNGGDALTNTGDLLEQENDDHIGGRRNHDQHSSLNPSMEVPTFDKTDDLLSDFGDDSAEDNFEPPTRLSIGPLVGVHGVVPIVLQEPTIHHYIPAPTYPEGLFVSRHAIIELDDLKHEPLHRAIQERLNERLSDAELVKLKDEIDWQQPYLPFRRFREDFLEERRKIALECDITSDLHRYNYLAYAWTRRDWQMMGVWNSEWKSFPNLKWEGDRQPELEWLDPHETQGRGEDVWPGCGTYWNKAVADRIALRQFLKGKGEWSENLDAPPYPSYVGEMTIWNSPPQREFDCPIEEKITSTPWYVFKLEVEMEMVKLARVRQFYATSIHVSDRKIAELNVSKLWSSKGLWKNDWGHNMPGWKWPSMDRKKSDRPGQRTELPIDGSRIPDNEMANLKFDWIFDKNGLPDKWCPASVLLALNRDGREKLRKRSNSEIKSLQTGASRMQWAIMEKMKQEHDEKEKDKRREEGAKPKEETNGDGTKSGAKSGDGSSDEDDEDDDDDDDDDDNGGEGESEEWDKKRPEEEAKRLLQRQKQRRIHRLKKPSIWFDGVLYVRAGEGTVTE